MVILIMYTVNKIVKGKVQGITEYGIFVKLDDAYNGLIHISEISDGFVKNIEDYVKINDVINVKILEVDEEKKQIKLSIKNIDYKNNDKRNNLKMIETNSGFRTLSIKLNFWIKDYLKNKKINKYY